MRRRDSIFGIGLAGVLAALWVNAARAQLTLTTEGTNAGFNLSTFVSGFPYTVAGGSGTEIGPIGVAVTKAGNVTVTNNSNNGVYTFNDSDGQTAPASPGHTSSNALFGMTTAFTGANQATYAVGLNTNALYKVGSSGASAFAGFLPGCNASCSPQSEGDGITTVPTTISASSPLTASDLLVLNGNNSEAGAGIYDVGLSGNNLNISGATPIVPFNSNVDGAGHDNGLNDGDGIAISPHGLYAYVAEGNDSVVAYSTLPGNNGVPLFTLTSGSSCTAGAVAETCVTGLTDIQGADGIDFIQGGSLANDFVVNTNYGELLLIDPDLVDPTLSTVTVIAKCTAADCSGDRGDFVSPDIKDGSLFVTQSTEIQRLTCTDPSICGSFVGGPSPVPEPSSLALFGAAVAGIRLFRRRRPATA